MLVIAPAPFRFMRLKSSSIPFSLKNWIFFSSEASVVFSSISATITLVFCSTFVWFTWAMVYVLKAKTNKTVRGAIGRIFQRFFDVDFFLFNINIRFLINYKRGWWWLYFVFQRQDLRARIGILFWIELHEALLNRQHILCFGLLLFGTNIQKDWTTERLKIAELQLHPNYVFVYNVLFRVLVLFLDQSPNINLYCKRYNWKTKKVKPFDVPVLHLDSWFQKLSNERHNSLCRSRTNIRRTTTQ